MTKYISRLKKKQALLKRQPLRLVRSRRRRGAYPNTYVNPIK